MINKLLWPKCRHAQIPTDETCRLPPGVVECPCLGRQEGADEKPIPVVTLSIDEGGQIVWGALRPNAPPAQYFTWTATTEPEGKGATVLFEAASQLPAPEATTQGFGFRIATKQKELRFVRASELLERGIDGREYVHAPLASPR